MPRAMVRRSAGWIWCWWATKSIDTRAAAETARSLVDGDTVVLTLQNGLGNLETLGEMLGYERMLLGMTYHGATLEGPGRARHTAIGQTFVGEPSGPLTARVERIAQAFTEAGLPTEATDSLWSLAWGKLIVNAAMNATCALTGSSGSDILASESARTWVGLVAHEAAAVAVGLGIALPYPDPAVRVWQHCATVGPARPSMLQDVQRGRLTEIDAINGAVVREGIRLGIPTPYNQALVLLVKAYQDTARAG
jgi:2-dehydropantoate 2-reductase